MGGSKKRIREALAGLPVLGRLMHRFWVYRGGLTPDALRTAVRKVGHYIDLRLGTGEPVPAGKINELDFLLRQVRRQGLAVDEPVRWALEMYAAARYGLRPGAGGGEPVAHPAAQAAVTAGSGDLEAAIRERRSVRRWTDEPVTAEEIRDIIDIARWAPSSCNRQPVNAMVVERPDDREFLAEYFPNRFHRAAPAMILVVVDQTPYGGKDRHFVYLDSGAFIQNLLLVLHSRGYGACWLGFKAWDNTGRVSVSDEAYEAFYERFGLPKHDVPVSAIAVGRPAAVPTPPPRKPLEQIIIERD